MSCRRLCVLALVSAEDEGVVHGILALGVTLSQLAKRLGGKPSEPDPADHALELSPD